MADSRSGHMLGVGSIPSAGLAQAENRLLRMGHEVSIALYVRLHVGAVQNMAGVGDTALAVGSSGGAAGPDGLRREEDHGGMVEQVSGWRQAKNYSMSMNPFAVLWVYKYCGPLIGKRY
ncbi:hypothetical protein MDA_GLEAN10006403 [Myotis davidii]|uniref:Uncharacterized protein n=1 Tax=Myotis davidii TaxID=225400 RepID=L5LWD9_MYODS|nr:hypothetical protein MDA_GLEAN10006403 [Myotis davidii]